MAAAAVLGTRDDGRGGGDSGAESGGASERRVPTPPGASERRVPTPPGASERRVPTPPRRGAGAVSRVTSASSIVSLHFDTRTFAEPVVVQFPSHIAVCARGAAAASGLTREGPAGVSAMGIRLAADVVIEGAGPAEIFEAVGRRVVNYALDGHNAVLLTAGPPGAGKTSVMYGPVARPSRYVTSLAAAAAAAGEWELDLRASFVEVGVGCVYDLLHERRAPVRVIDDPVQGTCLEGVTEVCIESARDADAVLHAGMWNRHAEPDGRHAGHTVFTMWLQRHRRDGAITTGRAVFVDLATAGDPYNSGLHHLQHCLRLVGRVAAREVPWRSTPLTRVLRPAITGTGLASFLFCAPAAPDEDEAARMLRFALAVRDLWTLARSAVAPPAGLTSARMLDAMICVGGDPSMLPHLPVAEAVPSPRRRLLRSRGPSAGDFFDETLAEVAAEAGAGVAPRRPNDGRRRGGGGGSAVRRTHGRSRAASSGGESGGSGGGGVRGSRTHR